MFYSLVQNKLVNTGTSNEDLNELLNNIDRKIYTLAIFELNNIRYGFETKIDYDLYDSLLFYKEVFLDKLLGCNCFQDQFLLEIISKIKKIIR